MKKIIVYFTCFLYISHVTGQNKTPILKISYEQDPIPPQILFFLKNVYPPNPSLGEHLYNRDSLIYPRNGDNSNLLLGNPSNASAVEVNNFLINGLYFTTSYNKGNAIPNWVSWHVNQDCFGTIKRSKGGFYPNTDLPAGWYQVLSSDYRNTGFDRGHQCLSADRTSSKAANTATFITTNIVPQAPNNNRKTWAALENHTRKLVQNGKEVYIICGAYGIGGKGSKGRLTERIADGRIVVPNRLWKIILVLNNGNNDLQRIDSSTRIIAVDMPNNNDIDADWRKFKVSVQSIEEATGYLFFSRLPKNLRNALICKTDSSIKYVHLVPLQKIVP